MHDYDALPPSPPPRDVYNSFSRSRPPILTSALRGSEARGCGPAQLPSKTTGAASMSPAAPPHRPSSSPPADSSHHTDTNEDATPPRPATSIDRQACYGLKDEALAGLQAAAAALASDVATATHMGAEERGGAATRQLRSGCVAAASLGGALARGGPEGDADDDDAAAAAEDSATAAAKPEDSASAMAPAGPWSVAVPGSSRRGLRRFASFLGTLLPATASRVHATPPPAAAAPVPSDVSERRVLKRSVTDEHNARVPRLFSLPASAHTSRQQPRHWRNLRVSESVTDQDLVSGQRQLSRNQTHLGRLQSASSYNLASQGEVQRLSGHGPGPQRLSMSGGERKSGGVQRGPALVADRTSPPSASASSARPKGMGALLQRFATFGNAARHHPLVGHVETATSCYCPCGPLLPAPAPVAVAAPPPASHPAVATLFNDSPK